VQYILLVTTEMSTCRKHFISRHRCSSCSVSRNWQWGPLKNHKRDYLNFPIVNCLF